jgi:hypothetical protein
VVDKALTKVQAKARVLVLEKEVKVNLADRAKALEAVKVQEKALVPEMVVKVNLATDKDKVPATEMDRAKALEKVVVRAKAQNPMFVVIVVAQVKKLLLIAHPLKIANLPFKKKPRNKPKRISVLNKKNAAKSVKRLPTKPKSKPKQAILKKQPIRLVKPKNVVILIHKKTKIT